jgi:hypothetical protein
MKHLHDFRTWFALAGVVAISLALFGATGKPWLLPLLPMGVAFAVRLKYGTDVVTD